MPRFKADLTSHCLPPQTAESSFPSSAERTRISNAERTEQDAGRRRREAREAVDWHEQTLRSLLRHKTDDRARLGLTALLAELTAGYGLGWSDIAKLVGVSVPAVRKWRHGGDISSARYQNIARLVAFLDMLADEEIHDPATWLNLSLEGFGDDAQSGVVTKKEIYRVGGIIDLLEYAKKHISQDELLSRVPVRTQDEPLCNRLVKAPDGNLSIVPNR